MHCFHMNKTSSPRFLMYLCQQMLFWQCVSQIFGHYPPMSPS